MWPPWIACLSLVTASIACESPSPGLAQANVVQDLGPVLAEALEASMLPAVGVAAIHAERGVVAIGVAGERALGSGVAVQVDDAWHLGSCTKSMTATLVARLAEDEVLGWDTTLGAVFGETREVHADWRDVTLLELVTHRSGANANPMGGGLWGRLREPADPRELRRLVVDLIEGPSPEARGEFLYSNTAYVLAGAVMEALTDVSYEQLLAREVFEPLGMTHAGFGSPGAPGAAAAEVIQGHRGDQPVPSGTHADNPAPIAPAGTVHAPLSDWARYVQAHLRGAAGDESFLSTDSWRRLHEPVGAYAPGWFVAEREWAGGRALTHNGSNTYWYCVAWLAPERGFAVLATTNRAGPQASPALDRLVLAALEHCGDSLGIPPLQRPRQDR